MTLNLDDPRLAQLLTDLVDRRVRAALDAQARIRYGTVAAIDGPTSTASLLLGGSTAPSPGFVFPPGSPPLIGDRVRAVNRGADRYIEENLTRTDAPVGWAPFTPRWLNTQTWGNQSTLAANGGCIALPMTVPAPMHCRGVRLWHADTTGAHSLEFRIYQEGDDGVLRAVPNASGSYGPVTNSAALARGIAFTGGTLDIRPGAYIVVLRNTHATTTFGVGHAGATAVGHLGHEGMYQGGSGQPALGATIDITGYTPSAAHPAVMLIANAAGMTWT